MKKVVKLNIALLAGLFFVFSLFPFSYVNAEKIQSGVTIINPGATTPPAGTCPDGNNDGVNDMTGASCTAPAGPTAGTCGLQIVSGAPINYGQLAPAQASDEKQVMIKNTGNSQTPAKLMIKGGNWLRDADSLNISGPELTRAAIAPIDFNNKKSLSTTGWELGQISGGQTIPVYFQLKVPINSLPTNDPSVSFHQDVTIDLLC